MMKKYLPALLFVLLASCNIETETDKTCFSNSYPPSNIGKLTIEQGLWGDIWFWKGDFMPGVSSGVICQVERTVYIYERTTFDDVEQISYSPFYSEISTNLVATVTSNSEGFFQVELEPGTYSIFVMENGNFYSNLFGSGGEIFPVEIEPGSVTAVQFDITYQAFY